MADLRLTPKLMEVVAERFKALGEPTRLLILNALRGGELTVSELMEETGLGQANLSRHLRTLHALNFVERRKEGLWVYYSLADERVFQLCDIMCGRLEEEARARRKLLGAR
jgi:DNA-binding transcriptional ArsR family regulator